MPGTQSFAVHELSSPEATRLALLMFPWALWLFSPDLLGESSAFVGASQLFGSVAGFFGVVPEA